MDNAATMNQEIDDEVASLKDLGIAFPDSYSKFLLLPIPKIFAKNSNSS